MGAKKDQRGRIGAALGAVQVPPTGQSWPLASTRIAPHPMSTAKDGTVWGHREGLGGRTQVGNVLASPIQPGRGGGAETSGLGDPSPLL